MVNKKSEWPMDEESLFLAALELGPSERRSFLEHACGGDKQLLRRVEQLLRSHQADSGFLAHAAIDQMIAALPLADATPASASAPRTSAADTALPESLTRHLLPSSVDGSLGSLNHYDLLQVIGSGGFGVVVKAIDQKLQRTVAIKFLLSERSHSQEIRQRFLREARVAAAIRHANIVNIYAVEEQPTPFIVMEYIQGQTLQEWIETNGKPSVEKLFVLSIAIAEALAAAHARGVIHRDIKPANILIESTTDQVKLMDFGLARAVDDASVTQSPLIAGTPQFMSPEQAEGKRLDPRSDLFSLGSVLYFLSTGRQPFSGDSTLAVMKHICDAEPPAIRSFNSDTPECFIRIVGELHAKSPDARPADASHVATSLREAMEWWHDPTSHARHPLQRTSKRNLTMRLVAPIAAIILAGLAVLWYPFGDNPPEHAKSSATPREAQMLRQRAYPVDAPTSADRLDPRRITETRLTLAGNGDPTNVPPGLVAILGESRFSHPFGPNQNSGITDIACSPRDQLVAVASAAYSLSQQRFVSWELKIWRLDTGRLVHDVQNLPAPVRGVVFSPDGKQLACICDQGTLLVSDAESWMPNWVAQAHTERGRAIDWSDDGQWIVSGGNDGGAVWNASAGTLVSRFREHPEMLLDVSFSHQSSSVIDSHMMPLPLPNLCVCSTDGHSTIVWRAATGERVGTVISTPSTVTRSVIFDSSSSAVLGAREDGEITTWNVEDGQARRHWSGHQNAVLQMVRNFDGTRLVTASLDGSIRIWNSSGQTLHVGPQHILHASSVAFTPDGKLAVSGDTSGQIHVWDVDTGRRLSHQHLGPARCVACNPDGNYLASGGDDGTVRLWDLATGTMLSTLFEINSPIRDLAWSVDGKLLAVASAQSLSIIEVASAKILKTQTVIQGPITQLEFTLDGQQLYFLTQHDETEASLRTWTITSNSDRPFSASKQQSPQCFAISHDGQTLAVGVGPNIVVYDLATRREQGLLRGHTARIRSLSFDAQSRRLASTAEKADASILIWDVEKQTILQRLETHSPSSSVCQWRADGSLLASSSQEDGDVHLWDVTQSWPTQNILPIFRSRTNSVLDMTMTPEGRYLVTANADGTLFVIQLLKRTSAE